MSRRKALLLSTLCTALLQGCASESELLQVTDNRGIGGSGRVGDSLQESERGLGGSGRVAQEPGLGGSGRQDEERGFGGSGLIADERGIGGSGRQPDSDRGIGGSGLLADERGIGGSGIRLQDAATERWLAQLEKGERVGVVGTIRDFGSIWVNGLHIEYDQQTSISEDGVAISATQMMIGQRVLVTAQQLDGALVADQIELVHEVIGPVSAVEGNVVTVLGQRVLIDDSSALYLDGKALPDVGDWIEVAGPRDSQQQIRASYVGEATPDVQQQKQFLLRGQLQQDQSQLHIDQQSLTTSVASQFALQGGEFVTLRGQLDGQQLIDVSVERPQQLTEREGVRLLSLERVVSEARIADGPYTPSLQPLSLARTTAHSQAQILEVNVQSDNSLSVERVDQPQPVNVQAQPAGAQMEHQSQPEQNSPGNFNNQNQGAASPSGPESINTPAPNNGFNAPQTIAPVPALQVDRPSQQGSGRQSRPQREERPSTGRSGRPGSVSRPQRPDTASRPETVERPQRPESIERPQRPGSVERPQRPETVDRPQVQRPDVERPTVERPDVQRPARPPRPERDHR